MRHILKRFFPLLILGIKYASFTCLFQIRSVSKHRHNDYSTWTLVKESLFMKKKKKSNHTDIMQVWMMISRLWEPSAHPCSSLCYTSWLEMDGLTDHQRSQLSVCPPHVPCILRHWKLPWSSNTRLRVYFSPQA